MSFFRILNGATVFRMIGLVGNTNFKIVNFQSLDCVMGLLKFIPILNYGLTRKLASMVDFMSP